MGRPFDVWLKETYPDICMECWGEGVVIFNGIFVKDHPLTCPACKGTGKESKPETATK
ncbi:hypothetical protein LCGC14_0664290 [marine sediment metagenome]|uniref:Uncharacterized protein n=1 Tax=marine sediment metagenome TaxID=412755 RepID=A0A0F9U122_9ZZZZ